jgi:mono/diheme cytochrome c family protein
MAALRMLAIVSLTAVSLAAAAGEEKVKLKEGPGLDKVRQNCVPCHSLDYIPLNSPFLDEKGWEATVVKMRKAYGAPIPEEDTAPLASYLAKYYGKR